MLLREQRGPQQLKTAMTTSVTARSTVKITSVEFSIRRVIDIVKMHQTMANDRDSQKHDTPVKRWKRWKTIGGSQTK